MLADSDAAHETETFSPRGRARCRLGRSHMVTHCPEKSARIARFVMMDDHDFINFWPRLRRMTRRHDP